jgi:TonB family protein
VRAIQTHTTIQTVSATPITAQTVPDHVIVTVPANGEKPKASFKIELDPEQVEMADTDPASRLKVVRLGRDTENVSVPQNGTLQVNPGVMASQIVTKTQPVYPQEAKDAKLSGAVVLDAVIGKDGTIKSLHLVSGPDVLAKSAWVAVKGWTYKPYLLNGEPVEVETTITVHYHLNGE